MVEDDDDDADFSGDDDSDNEGEGSEGEGEEVGDDDHLRADVGASSAMGGAAADLRGAVLDDPGDADMGDTATAEEEEGDDEERCEICCEYDPPNCSHAEVAWVQCSECVAWAHAVCVRSLPGRIRPREWACADCR